MPNKIKALFKKPGKEAKLIKVDNTLHAFQDLVGGDIETFSFSNNAIVVCNGNGRLEHLPFNCYVYYKNERYPNSFPRDRFVGNILIVSCVGDEFSDFDESKVNFKCEGPYNALLDLKEFK